MGIVVLIAVYIPAMLPPQGLFPPAGTLPCPAFPFSAFLRCHAQRFPSAAPLADF